MAEFSAHATHGGRLVAPGSIMPMAQRYWVSGKDGIAVRAQMSLESDEVGDVAHGAAVSVMGFGDLESGKRRARLAWPVKGWCSAKLLSPGLRPDYGLPRRRDGGKLRILCLHGGGTSGAIFRAQLHAIAPELAEYAEFRFVDGPLEAPAEGPEFRHMKAFFPGLVGEGLYSWMRIVQLEADGSETDVVDAIARALKDAKVESADDVVSNGARNGQVLVGRPATHGAPKQAYRREADALRVVVDHVRAYEPDGLMGFSQGSNVASLLMSALENGADLGDARHPRFLVSFCGTHWGWADDFRARSDAVARGAGLKLATPLYSSKLRVPSLHVIADDDPRKDFSESFKALFENPVVRRAPNSHKPPVEPRFADEIAAFLQGALAGETRTSESPP